MMKAQYLAKFAAGVAVTMSDISLFARDPSTCLAFSKK